MKQKQLPRYPLVNATLPGRLAVRKQPQGRRLGGILLSLALRKAYENTAAVGSSMVVVDAIDKQAAQFYAAHRLIGLPELMRPVLPRRTIAELASGT
jgi:GNAT superfamily N-acetyltransferase